MEHINDETIAVEEIPQEELSKEELIKQIDTLNGYIKELEKQNDNLIKAINDSNKEMDLMAREAQRLFETLEENYDGKIKAILTIMKSVETLLNQPNFKQEEQ